ncbi:MAG: hypothetical protein ACRCZP_20095 [Phycicoccus sp.]
MSRRVASLTNEQRAATGPHAPLLVGPGTYVVRRQREQTDEIRLVAD